MKHNLSPLLGLIVVACFVLTACDSTSTDNNDVDLNEPSSLVGTWDLKSVTDKEGAFFNLSGQTLTAGETFTVNMDIGGGQVVSASFLVEGVLTLQSSRYTMQMDITVTVTGQPPEIEANSDYGTWSVAGNTLTVISEAPDEGGTQALTISTSGNTMTLEDEEMLMVFEKR